MTRIVLCPPVYFTVIHYQLNKHMTLNRKPKPNLVKQQYQQLIKILRQYHIQLHFIKPVKGLADMVFTANAGLVIGKKALITCFAASPRKPERAYYLEFFKDQGYDIKTIKHYFEGQGDAILSHNNQILWIGYSFRTEKDAVTEIKHLIGPDIQTLGLELSDPYFYHLDTCFCPLPDHYLLYFPEAFTEKSQLLIKKYFGKKLIPVTRKEALDFSCNSLCLWVEKYQQYVFIAHKISNRLKTILNKLQIRCRECRMSEFLLSGGSVKCCCLVLDR